MKMLRLYFLGAVGLIALVAPGASDTKPNFFSYAALSGSLQSSQTRLIVTETCPTHGPPCMIFDVVFDKTITRTSVGTTVNYDNNIEIDISKERGTALVAVSGRLNGGIIQTYQLVFRHPVSELDCQDSVAAALGVFDDGGGILLTDQGPLEIVSPPLSIGGRDSIYIIEKKSLKVEPRLSPGWEKFAWFSDLIVTMEGKTLWRKSNSCLDLDSSEGFQTLPAKACLPKKLLPADPEDVERLQDEGTFSEEHLRGRLRYDLKQIPDSDYLIFVYGVACT